MSSRGLSALVLLWALTLPMRASAADAPTISTECWQGISEATTRRVFDALNAPMGGADCTFDGVRTDKSILVATWMRGSTPLPQVQVLLRKCLVPPPAGTGDFVVQIPPELGQQCAAAGVAAANLPKLLAGEVASYAGAAKEDTHLFPRAQALFAAVVLIFLVVLIRAFARRKLDWKWGAAATALFAISVGARLAVEPTLTNWYSEVLPVVGRPDWMRFGPGNFAFQALIRYVLPWNERTLFASQIGLGAFAVVLFFGVVRELLLELDVAVCVGLLFATTAFHVRISASASEAVLSSTLTIALLFTWLRALRTGDKLLLLLALLLIPATISTRVNDAIPVALIPLWSLVRDRVERTTPARRMWTFHALFACVAVLTAWYAYDAIVIPSNHPGPELKGMELGFVYALRQFGDLALRPPHWFPLTVVVSTAVGALIMAWQRPWLLVRVVVTVVASFTLLGRNFMHDELVGARYFLFTLPLFLLPAGYAWAWLARMSTRAVPRMKWALGGVAWGGLLAWSVAQSASAYTMRYAFQDEYSFLRRALAKIPDGCRVYALAMRNDALDRDTDCCLDLSRTPLGLAFPRLDFAPIKILPPPELVKPTPSCVVYYETSACDIADNPANQRDWGKALTYFKDTCAKVRGTGKLELLDQAQVAQKSTNDLFDAPPRVALYRWTK